MFTGQTKNSCESSHAPPVPVKTSHKKMAAIGSTLYFMFLGPPLTILDPMLKELLKTTQTNNASVIDNKSGRWIRLNSLGLYHSGLTTH